MEPTDLKFVHQLIEIKKMDPDGSKKNYFYSSLPSDVDEEKAEIMGYILRNECSEKIENSPHFDTDGNISLTDFVNWYKNNHERAFSAKLLPNKLKVYHSVADNGHV